MAGLFGFSNGFGGRRVTAHGSELSPFCTSPSQLQDVKKSHNFSNNSLLSNSLGMRTREQQTEMARRSMREQEEQIAALHKENFNLKLRVYFLEERDSPNGGAVGGGCEKQNIELKIEIESLKHDLDSKQELLQQAAKAIEIMEENQREAALEHDRRRDALQARIYELEDEIKSIKSSIVPDAKAIMAAAAAAAASAGSSCGVSVAPSSIFSEQEEHQENTDDETCRQQNAFVDLENKLYELQSDLLERDAALADVRVQLDRRAAEHERQELTLEQRGLEVARLQMSVASYKARVQDLETELRRYHQEQAVTSSSTAMSNNDALEIKVDDGEGGELNVIKSDGSRGCANDSLSFNGAGGELQRLRDLLAKRDAVIKKHENAHRCACKVIQTFMQKNKEMSRELDRSRRCGACGSSGGGGGNGSRRDALLISNSLPLPACDGDAISSGLSPNSAAAAAMLEQICAKRSSNSNGSSPSQQRARHSYQHSGMSEDARHERENETANSKLAVETAETDTIESIEKFYKCCLQTKEEQEDYSSVSSVGNKSQSRRKSPRSSPNKLSDYKAPVYTKLVEENKQLAAQIEDLRTELRNTPERDNDSALVRQLRKEISETKAQYDHAKCELQTVQLSTENMSSDLAHLQEVCLTLREHLEELAGFLKTLIRSDINASLGLDRLEKIKNAVDKSLDLSRSVGLSVSGISRDNNSLIQLSSLSAYLDTSGVDKLSSDSQIHDNIIMDQAETISNLQHEISLLKKQLLSNSRSGSGKQKVLSATSRLVMDLDHSESETWSEPDKNVSLSRIGLQDMSNVSPRRKSATHHVSKNVSTRRKLLSATDAENAATEVSPARLLEDLRALEARLVESDRKILEGECALLKADNEYKQEKLRMVTDMEAFKLQKVHTETALKDTLMKLSTAEMQCCELQQRVCGLDRELKEERAFNEVLKEKLKMLEANFAELQAEKNRDASAAEDSVLELTRELGDLKQKYDDVRVSLTESQHINEELCRQIDILRQDKSAAVENHLREIDDLNNKYRDDLKEHWVAKTEYTDKCSELERVALLLREKESILALSETDEAKKLKYLEDDYNKRLAEGRRKEMDLLKKLTEREAEYKILCRDSDALTLQLSQITIDRTRLSNEKMKLEKDLHTMMCQHEQNSREQELRISELERSNAELGNKLVTLQTVGNIVGVGGECRRHSGIVASKMAAVEAFGCNSSDEGGSTSSGGAGRRDGSAAVDRLCVSSPDLGIESDQGPSSGGDIMANIERPLLKTLELTKSMSNILDFDTKDDVTVATEAKQHGGDAIVSVLERENVQLRKKLVSMRRTLEEALNQILASNKRKKQVEKDVAAQLHKTYGVLRQVRNNLETTTNVQNVNK